MSDREPVNLGYPYVESFHSDFSGTGGVDQTDRSTNIDEHTIEEMHQIASRYPDSRSALLPILHLVQSVDGRISPVGIETAAEVLGITTAQVSGVATFYTMYKKHPAGQHHIGVCTTALCASWVARRCLPVSRRSLALKRGRRPPTASSLLSGWSVMLPAISRRS
ncbi:NADH-ubiquinone oxidoreductase [Cutibacterium acnes JCM 18909]|nr:NADH-ubiquinone oxidoreductase [Cutibacterium acnes JCM 18909]